MLIECPSCYTKLRAPDGSEGTEVRCPKCRELLTVPDEYDEPGPSPRRERYEEEPPRRRPERRDDWDDDDDYPPRYRANRFRHEPATNGLAIASMIVGIVSLPLILCWPIGVPLGITAIVLGAIGMRQPEGRGMGIAGLVTGIVTLVLFLGLLIFGVATSAFGRRF
jgi:hypothetical protein